MLTFIMGVECLFLVRDIMIRESFVDVCSLGGIFKDHKDIMTHYDDSDALIE